MRVLMWFTIGFAMACGAAVYGLNGNVPVWAVAAAMLLCAGAVLLRRRRFFAVAAVVLAGFAAGLGWYFGYDAIQLKTAREYDGQTLLLSIEATDYSYENDYGIVVDGVTELEGKRYQVRAYVNQEAQLSPGCTVTGEFRLRYTASGGQEDPTYHRGEGTFLLAYPKGEAELTLAEETPGRFLAARLRQTVLRTIEEIFPEDTAAFAKALLLGDSNGLDYETDTAFKLSGIRHVIAVSGLHVSILFSIVYAVTSRRRYLTAIVGIPLLVLFAAMAGFTPSIVRACMMQLLMVLAALFPREYDPPTGLAFAVLLMLGINPQTISSVGFQLSVGSVAGIFLFSGRIRKWLQEKLTPAGDGKRKLARWLQWGIATVSSGIAVTLSAMTLTTPLAAWYFGTVSLIGPVTNLLTLWIVNFLFCGIIAACLLAFVWLPAGQAVAWVISWGVRYVTGTAKALGGLPLAAVYTESVYIILWLAFVYGLLVIFLVSRQKRPAVLGCCAALGLCVALLGSWLEPLGGSWRMTALDVGQGQCILLQSGGKTYMVDCGGSSEEGTADLAAATLLSKGISHLDGLILTHYDVDHTGGASFLLTRVGADTVYLPRGNAPENLVLPAGQESVTVTEDLTLSWDGAKLTLFASNSQQSDNERSLCVLFQTEKCDILITGDRSASGELELLAGADLPKLEVLVAGHHGAATSTSEPLLRATRPEIVVISVEANNRYGQPAQSVLERLETYGCQVRRTDREGTITLWG